MYSQALNTILLFLAISFLSFACNEPASTSQPDSLPVEQQVIEPEETDKSTPHGTPEEKENSEEITQAPEIEVEQPKALCEFIINWRYHGDIALLDSAGTVIQQLSNDPENEDFLMGKVLRAENGMFAVQIKKAQATAYETGYMRPNEHLGFFLSNYSNDTIDAYENIHDAFTLMQITEYDPSFFQLLDVQEGFVEIAREGDTIGWIGIEYVCANPYTTCN